VIYDAINTIRFFFCRFTGREKESDRQTEGGREEREAVLTYSSSFLVSSGVDWSPAAYVSMRQHTSAFFRKFRQVQESTGPLMLCKSKSEFVSLGSTYQSGSLFLTAEF
jgi:hypothetical protein